ncbi:MAG: tRNA (cytidine(34)-2'-O)-methyltransferase [Syntrophobacteraceae bacterium]
MILDAFNTDHTQEDIPYIPRFRSCEKLGVLLYQPEIPQNTGNIARTCAATHTPLYLVGPLGFRLTDKLLKRAGLDYWPHVRMKLYPDFDAAHTDMRHSRLVYFSARAPRLYYDFSFCAGDCLVFGPETRGLPEELLASYPGDVVKVPIDRVRVRSLNLATTVGIALFEALRQLSH